MRFASDAAVPAGLAAEARCTLAVLPCAGGDAHAPLSIDLVHATPGEDGTTFGFSFGTMNAAAYMALADLMYGDPDAIARFLAKRRSHKNLVAGSWQFLRWGIVEPTRAITYVARGALPVVAAWLRAKGMLPVEGTQANPVEPVMLAEPILVVEPMHAAETVASVEPAPVAATLPSLPEASTAAVAGLVDVGEAARLQHATDDLAGHPAVVDDEDASVGQHGGSDDQGRLIAPSIAAVRFRFLHAAAARPSARRRFRLIGGGTLASQGFASPRAAGPESARRHPP